MPETYGSKLHMPYYTKYHFLAAQQEPYKKAELGERG